MSDPILSRLELVGVARREANEKRLCRTRRALGQAIDLRRAAERQASALAEMEQALIQECYADPACEQAWIARACSAKSRKDAEENADDRRASERAIGERKAIEAKALLKDDVRLSAISDRLARARLAAMRRAEDARCDERADYRKPKAMS
jgi:hypothetical protein